MRVAANIKRMTGTAVLVVLALAMLLAACSQSADDSASAGDAAADGGLSVQTEQASSAADDKSAANKAASAESKAVTATADTAAGSPETPDAALTAPDAALGGSGTDAEGFDRKIVYRANLTMEVEDFGKAGTALRNVLHQSGGYILTFSDSKPDAETGAVYTLKVPASGFMSFVDRLEQIEHTDFERQLKGTDVSEEYVDLTARLKAKEVVETRLLAFMDKATKAADLLQFSNQLAGVQDEIERIKGRMRYLDANVAYSTVELRLYQPLEGTAPAAAGTDPLGARMGEALTSSAKNVGAMLQGLLVFAAAALPVLVLLAVLALPVAWLVRRALRSRPARPVPAPGTGVGGGEGGE